MDSHVQILVEKTLKKYEELSPNRRIREFPTKLYSAENPIRVTCFSGLNDSSSVRMTQQRPPMAAFPHVQLLTSSSYLQ